MSDIRKILQIRKRLTSLLVLLLASLLVSACNPTSLNLNEAASTPPQSAVVALPSPRLKGEISLEEALVERRSVRDFSPEPLTLIEVSQLLWAAQGKTAEWGGRTAPSAGALYPLEIYLIAGNVQGLSSGIYQYNPESHEIVKIKDGDLREQLSAAAVGQACVRQGAISFVIAAVYARTTGKYGDRGVQYVHLEAGHAAQNICLQVTSLDLGAVTIGAFSDEQVRDVAGLSQDESPLYIISVGRKAD